MAHSIDTFRIPHTPDTTISTRQERFKNHLVKPTAILLGASALVFGGIKATETVAAAVEANTVHCSVDEDSSKVALAPGETVWSNVAEPLAEQLDVPINEALSYVGAANPGVNLSRVNEPIVVPTCEKG